MAPPLLMLLFALVPVDAAALSVSGRVRGGAEAAGLRVVLLRDRNLRAPAVVLGHAPVDSNTGTFEVQTNAPPPVWIAVTRCSAAELRASRFDAGWWVFPRHEPLTRETAADVVLQVPDPDAMAAAWTTQRSPDTGRLRWFVLLAIALGLLGAAWLWRRPSAPLPPREPAEAPFPRWMLAGGALAVAALWAFRLGSEPLDLLEYSYFLEGLRPDSLSGVFSNPVSAALAHGPVQPLILRGLAQLDTSPWLLRLPSLVFGLGFLLVVVTLVRAELGRAAALGAAAVALTAPLAVFYARDATPYALAGLCAALSVWLILRARDSERAPRWWLAFCGVTLLGFFTHYAYAFVPLSQAVALTAAWLRRRPRDLAYAALALSAAAIPAAIVADHLEHMVVLSGIQFGLISPVYPISPGLLAFGGRFLCVLTSMPSDVAWLLLLSVPLSAAGFVLLRRRSSLLAWLLGAQLGTLLLFVVFTHTMSTLNGGGRVFYAFRWARPLLLGAIVPLGAVLLDRRLAGGLAVLLAVAGWQSVGLLLGPTRPAHDDVRALIAEHGKGGDAYAVLPAAFYGDPLQYYLADGSPPDLITGRRTADLRVGAATVHGPLVEGRWSLETRLDRLEWERIWVVAYREAMLGEPKFDPDVVARTVALLDHQATRLDTWRLPFVDVFLYACRGPCAWVGKSTITIDLSNRFQASRYLERQATPGTIRLVLPADATRVLVRRRPGVAKDPAHTVSFAGARLADVRLEPDRWVADLRPGTGRIRLQVTPSPPLRPDDLVLRVTR